MTELDELQAFCDAHDLPWTARAAERFALYVELLEKFNAKMNLIGPLDRRQIVRELLIDSVAAAVLSPPRTRVLDIGTGAGLPGIPLAILYPDVEMTLVEPRQKRVTFMRIATTRLGLDHIDIVPERIENIDLEPHDWLISKAFRAPTEWIEIAAPHLADGGHIVCLHATDATEGLRARADELSLDEVAHVKDVATELGANVPPGRAVSVFV